MENFRYIDRIKTTKGEILQVSSRITGRIAGDFRDSPGDIFWELLPAGSVTGAPKKRTVEIIKEIEK